MPSILKKLLNCIVSSVNVLLGCGCSKPGKVPKLAPGDVAAANIPVDDRDYEDEEEDNDEDEEEEEDYDGKVSPGQHPNTSPNYLREFGTEYPRISTRVVSPCRKITNSVAFVKDSEDPYRDFRRSMLQMIFDREIRSREDLQELLNCFLQLNSPSHHDAIIQAFTEIWNGVFSDRNRSRQRSLDL